MSERPSLGSVVAELARLAAQTTGFGPESIRPRALERAFAVLESGGWSRERVLQGARNADPEIVRAVRDAVVVGETWFFRQPEQFAFLAEEVVPRWLAAGLREIRAWSAGCATGAETYSLAATLLRATTGHDVAVRVLGTDLLDRNVAVALGARYRRQDVRASTPPPIPVVRALDGDTIEVLPEIRQITQFRQHSLLDAPPEGGPFHVVMCRHVLVYFTPEATERACAVLTSALVPDGALVLGTMDRLDAPPGLEALGPPELQTFRAPVPRAVRRATSAVRTRAVVLGLAPDPVAVHLACLRSIESGHAADAARLLDELCVATPDYLPARVERALLCARAGDRRRATELMLEVARETERRDPGEVLAGPEPLPVRFYRDAALSFLAGRRDREIG